MNVLAEYTRQKRDVDKKHHRDLARRRNSGIDYKADWIREKNREDEKRRIDKAVDRIHEMRLKRFLKAISDLRIYYATFGYKKLSKKYMK